MAINDTSAANGTSVPLSLITVSFCCTPTDMSLYRLLVLVMVRAQLYEKK
jgi:hypothetical protein